MANDTCPQAPHLSSLDPGVGKTQVVIHFLRTLIASADHGDVGVLIGVQRLEQIVSIVRDAGLDMDDYAVLTSDDCMNALGRGVGQHRQARVLFTIHAMLERRMAGDRSFAALEDFHFRGKPRAVRVWDEAFLPGRPLTVSRYSICHLFHYLKADYPFLVADLEELAERLKTAPDGSQFELPDLDVRHGVSIDQIRAVVRGKGDAATIADTLWHLFGRMVTVRQDAGVELDGDLMKRGNTVLDYHDTIPDDFWPVLILDASGRVRTTYKLWEERRLGLVRLPEGQKSYKGHTVHFWPIAGSKMAWKRHGQLLAQGIADTIR